MRSSRRFFGRIRPARRDVGGLSASVSGASGRASAEQQGDDCDIPKRPATVPETEIQAVQAVVQPALQSVEAMDGRDGLPERRIDVHPRAHGVRELHAQDRKRRLAIARIVVGVVSGEHLVLRDRLVRECGPKPLEERLGAEGLCSHPQRRRVHEQARRGVGGPDGIGLVQSFRFRIRQVIGRVAREEVRRVFDAPQLDFLRRGAVAEAQPVLGPWHRKGREIQRSAAERVGAHAEPFGVRPRERLHRQQSAEGPSQGKHPEHRAEHVVPAHPARVANRTR